MLASTAGLFGPGPLRCFDDEQETSKVPADPEVAVMADQSPAKRFVLIRHRKVSMAATPDVDAPNETSRGRTTNFVLHPATTSTGSRPIERETEKVERGRTHPALLRRRRTPKPRKTGLDRIQGESESRKSLSENIHHWSCIVFEFEANRLLTNRAKSCKRSQGVLSDDGAFGSAAVALLQSFSGEVRS